jgi:starch phosphorylase
MVRDYVEQYYVPAAQSLRKTVAAPEGAENGAVYEGARELAAYRRRAEEAWPKIVVTDVDSTGLPDTPVLGSKLTLTATVYLAGLSPDEVTVQAVLGRVDSGDVLLDPVAVDMSYTGAADAGNQVFSTTTPLPLAGALGYTVRVLPRHPMLAAPNELGLVTLA